MLKKFTYLISLTAMFCLWAAAEVHAAAKPKPADTILQILTPKRVFVTGQVFDGDLGGLAGADGECQAAADAVGLGGVWQAWLSDSNSSPTLRWATHAQAHYFMLDGQVIAANYADLIDGALATPINITENVTVFVHIAFTGTESDGTPSGTNCSDWTSTGGIGTVGDTNAADALWTNHSDNICGGAWSLYCFEQ